MSYLPFGIAEFIHRMFFYLLRTNIDYVRTCLEHGDAYKFSLKEPA